MAATGDSSESVKENAGAAIRNLPMNYVLAQNPNKNKSSPDDPVLLNNRLTNEFGPLDKLTSLGKGFSGEVYEVKRGLDGDKYAVKIISLKLKESSLVPETLPDTRVTIQLDGNPRLKKLRREVESLKQLQHKNIVRYYDSWIERKCSDFDNSGIQQRSLNNESSGNDKSSEHSSSIEFRDDSKSSDVSQNGIGLKPEGDTSSGIHGNKESSGSDESSRPSPYIEVFLCIKMELCSMDLKKWLTKRNKTNGTVYPWEFEMVGEVIRIFKEMVEGLRCIHESKIMHTDLKPANVFLTGPDLTVKIGDFGFSKYVSEDMEQECEEHTLRQGGNQLYPAPEILKISDNNANYAYYDCKVDIYSLGIIHFEMCNSFRSESEKTQIIGQLRKKGICPDIFKKWSKAAAALIEKLIHKTPELRPTAAQILSDGLFLPVSDYDRSGPPKLLEMSGQKSSTTEENVAFGVKHRASKLPEKTTSVSTGAGDASAAKGFTFSGATVNAESTPELEMLGLKMKD